MCACARVFNRRNVPHKTKTDRLPINRQLANQFKRSSNLSTLSPHKRTHIIQLRNVLHLTSQKEIQVETEEAKEWAQSNGVLFVETSVNFSFVPTRSHSCTAAQARTHNSNARIRVRSICMEFVHEKNYIVVEKSI